MKATMLNTASIHHVRSHTFRSVFRAPTYSGYSFSNIPTSIPSFFSPQYKLTLAKDVFQVQKQYKQVVLFFIDAFGWKFIEAYKEHPVLQKLMDRGVVSMLSSQFPSTTAAHVTCMNTGLAVGESGVYEWNYYEPTLDAVIQPLLFSLAGETVRETLQEKHVDPRVLFPQSSVYPTLHTLGVQTHIVQDALFAQSSYGSVVMADTMIHPYTSLAGARSKMETLLQDINEKKYLYFYYAGIDKAGHEYGPDSVEFSQAVTEFLEMLGDFLNSIERHPDTLFLMTADHGQTKIYKETCWYINREAPELLQFFEKTKTGAYKAPCGSARDMFLHVEEEHLAFVAESLQKKLHGIAEVVPTKELIELGFFGPTISKAFLSRVGNLVILPFAGQSVWWYEEGVFWQKHIGHHGGLTPEEMETVLITYSLGS